MNLNKACLMGRISRDPYYREGSGPKPSFASISLATNDFWVDKAGERHEKAEFHHVVFFGRLADVVGKHCKQGALLYVEGRLQTREENEKLRKTEIVGNFLQMNHQRFDVDGPEKKDQEFDIKL